jgi:aminopeptidase N
MDEGFASFISTLYMNEYMGEKKENPFEGAYKGYFRLVSSGTEQPQTTHADRYNLNFAYGISAYSKGEIFLSQLGYVIGQDKLMETLRKYFDAFKFKHPTPNDLKRTAEKVSGMELDWYLTDWTQTTNTIDYGIKEVAAEGEGSKVTLERIGLMPMPIDLLVIYADGSQETFYAPLRMMHGQKENPYPSLNRTVLPDWAWAYPNYSFSIKRPVDDIQAVVLDPSQLMADIDRENNIFQAAE